MYLVYIFVCKYVCIAVVCLFGVGSYGLASTEAGATPASLVVISPHPEMYFWKTRCCCASLPPIPRGLKKGDSQAGVDRPRGGSRTHRRRKNRPKKPRACWQVLQALFFGPALIIYSTPKGLNIRSRRTVRCATGRTGCDNRTPLTSPFCRAGGRAKGATL